MTTMNTLSGPPRAHVGGPSLSPGLDQGAQPDLLTSDTSVYRFNIYIYIILYLSIYGISYV